MAAFSLLPRPKATRSQLGAGSARTPTAHTAPFPSESSKREASGYARPSFISSKGLKSPRLRKVKELGRGRSAAARARRLSSAHSWSEGERAAGCQVIYPPPCAESRARHAGWGSRKTPSSPPPRSASPSALGVLPLTAASTHARES